MSLLTEQDCIECGLCCYFPTAKGKVFYDGKIVLGNDHWCIHRKKGEGCDIYKDRPKVCEMFEMGGDECLYYRKTRKHLNNERKS